MTMKDCVLSDMEKTKSRFAISDYSDDSDFPDLDNDREMSTRRSKKIVQKVRKSEVFKNPRDLIQKFLLLVAKVRI